MNLVVVNDGISLFSDAGHFTLVRIEFHLPLLLLNLEIVNVEGGIGCMLSIFLSRRQSSANMQNLDLTLNCR